MANIDTYLQAIMSAVYGEEVRGSIHDAIDLINKVGEKVISAGTDVTSASSSSEGYYDKSLYLNDETWDLWQCTGTDTWTLLGNIKGSGIDHISKTATSGLTDTYTVYYQDGTTDTFNITNGKTAYQSAVEGGYPGTEQQFNQDLAEFKDLAEDADERALDAEAYAIGKRDGQDVPSTDPAYHNNSLYYMQQAAGRGATHACQVNPDTTVTPYGPDWLVEDGVVVLPDPKDIYRVPVDGKDRQYFWNTSVTPNRYEVLSGGGHTILYQVPNGSIMPMGQRDNMLFDGIKVTDDEPNGRTVIHGQLKVCATEAEWNLLSQSEKDDPNTYWVRPWADTVAFATDKTPVGTVLSVATGKTGDGITGVTTPTGAFPTADYLVCDGSMVNLAEYPALAQFFTDRYGSAQYFTGTAQSGKFTLPDWSADFPSNGVLVIKARQSSNAITFAEIDDASVSEDKLWSSEKIDGEIDKVTGNGDYVSVNSYEELKTALTNKRDAMTMYTIETMFININTAFTEFPTVIVYQVDIARIGTYNLSAVFTNILNDVKHVCLYSNTWTIDDYGRTIRITVSPSSGSNITTGNIRISKIGKTVSATLFIDAMSGAVGSSTVLFNIPEGYRPDQTAADIGMFYWGDGQTTPHMYGGYFTIETNGNVKQAVSTSNFKGKALVWFNYTTK